DLLSSLVLCFPRQLASVFFVHPLYMGVSIKKPTLNGRMNNHMTTCVAAGTLKKPHKKSPK
ncbi:MAG: hypothetical protein LBI35_01485, partial [Burkholderiales bacterium]|nr:hypothetical protein [Burkholderiales bacterium]